MTGVTGGDAAVVDGSEPAIERSPSDLLRLVVATVLLVLLLVVQAMFGDTLVTFAASLLRGLDAVPTWMIHTVVVATRVLAVVMLGGGLVVTVWRGRWRLLLTVLVAGVAAVLVAWLLDSFAPDPSASVVDLDHELIGPLTAAGFPTAAGVAAVSAVLTAAAPSLSRRWRRVGWVLVVGVTVMQFASSAVS